MKTVRWGIVSTGRIADQFCQDLVTVANAEIAAVAARNIDSAQTFADKFGIGKAYQGYQAMFDDPTIDVVYIGTPHTFHFQHSYDALMAGKSVLCEKPFTVSVEQCQILSELAKSKGLFLMEAMWTYFLPAIKQAKAWVDAGKIGNIKHVKADFGYPIPYDEHSREYSADLAGGCLLDMGIYPLAIAHYFLGKDIRTVDVKTTLAPNGVDQDVVFLAQYDQALATLASSFQCKLPNSAYIIGTEGTIEIPNFWQADQCTLYHLDEQIDHFKDQRTTLGFNFEAEAVTQALLNNVTESDTVPHETSEWFQTWLTAIKKAF